MSDMNYTGDEASRLARKRVTEAEAKAKEQAAKDALITKAPVEVELKPGHVPTLTQLNEMAERANRANTDIFHEAALATARVVKKTLQEQGAGKAQHQRIAKAAAKQQQAVKNVDVETKE